MYTHIHIYTYIFVYMHVLVVVHTSSVPWKVPCVYTLLEGCAACVYMHHMPKHIRVLRLEHYQTSSISLKLHHVKAQPSRIFIEKLGAALSRGIADSCCGTKCLHCVHEILTSIAPPQSRIEVFGCEPGNETLE